MVLVTEVDSALLSKLRELHLLICPTDEEFVMDLALYMMKNPITVLTLWLYMVI